MTNQTAGHIKQIAPDEVRRIVQKLRDGLGRNAVAKAHGIGPERLSAIAVANGLPATVRTGRDPSRVSAVHRARAVRTCSVCGKAIGIGVRYRKRRRDSMHLDCSTETT